eukprot:764658-Hanusia_phi.AAC.3
MRYEDELSQDMAERVQALLKSIQGQGAARQARHSFSAEWERALLDRDICFAIANDTTFKPGIDRLKRWDQILREEELGSRRKQGILTISERFLLEEDAGRGYLGKALQTCKGSILRTSIQAITFSTPTRKKLFEWKKTNSPDCPWCEGRKESWGHIQWICKEFQLLIQQAHNMVMEGLKQGMQASWKRRGIPFQTWWQQPVNKMGGLDIRLKENGHLILDGCCFFPDDKRVVLIEIARTSEYDGSYRRPGQLISYDQTWFATPTPSNFLHLPPIHSTRFLYTWTGILPTLPTLIPCLGIVITAMVVDSLPGARVRW